METAEIVQILEFVAERIIFPPAMIWTVFCAVMLWKHFRRGSEDLFPKRILFLPILLVSGCGWMLVIAGFLGA